MKKIAIAIVAIALLPTLALADTWSIDPVHTASTFAVKHLVISTVRGSFGKTTGTVSIDDADVTRSSVEATIDATTITTGIEKRDGHLKSADFFDVAKYPTLTFKSTKVEKGGEGLKVTGNLTMRGVTKAVVLDATTPSATIKSPFGDLRRGLSAHTKLSRKEFGLAWNNIADSGPVVGDEIQVQIDVELFKAAK